jgi:hypothetical protein
MYQTILLAILFLIVIYLLYQNYSIQREIYKIKNSFDELNNFLDLSIKKTKPKVLDTLSSINTTDITDNVITYSNDVRRVKVETTINSDENKIKNSILEVKEQNNHYIIENNNEFNEKPQLQNNNDDDVQDYENEDDNVEEDDDVEEEDDVEEDEEDKEDDEEDEEEDDEEEEDDDDDDDLNFEDINELDKSIDEDNNERQDIRHNVLNNIKKSINNQLNDDENNIKIIKDVNEPDSDSDSDIEIEKIGMNDEDKQVNNIELKLDADVSEKQDNKIEINTEVYSIEKLNKMTINNIKDIAKKLKVVLSVSGKAKNKEQLIKDILQRAI